jgi:hypothetical protein
MSLTGFMMMTVFQMVTTVWCMRWYARKHPDDAREMLMMAKQRLMKMISR